MPTTDIRTPAASAPAVTKRVDLKKSGDEAYRKDDLPRARTCYVAHLAAFPNDGGAWTNLGVVFRREKNYPAALRAQEQAYRCAPEAPAIRNNLANILDDTGGHERAAALRRDLVRARPDDIDNVAMLGRSLRSMKRYGEAEAVLKAGLERNPDHAEMRLQLALTQLSGDNYVDGFRNYGARWRTGAQQRPQVAFERWEGQPLAGKSLLVLPEQGFGDTLNFSRFFPAMKAMGASVTFLCKKPLFRLMAKAQGADRVLPGLPKDAAFDYWTSMMDIPEAAFAASPDIPPPPAVIVPDDSRQRAAHIVRPFENSFKVGVVWTGSAGYDRNAFRSCGHQQFLQLADVANVKLFSLYKGPFLDDYVKDGTSAFILDTGSSDRDLADCAATIEAMDLIITTDTVTAHIAGALGKDTWNLLHWDAFWLYGHEGDSTPWYPSMKLYRQDIPGDWDTVFATVKADLAQRVEEAGRGGR